ncbi:MAG: peptidase M48 [Gammaproteobacteria bacterium]|jgi:predicted Zn-dependent protease|nr:peptidase M48 [Gammaproteobacteria bacterium]|tara:strand:+ start:18641 stop:20086 length:1446 start_codon:yes stop_codon:yes gene_type:complete
MNMLSALILLSLLPLSLAAGGAVAADSQNLPELGDATSGIVSLAKEREIGQDFLRSLRAQAPTLDDPILQDYLEHLMYRLASYSQLQDRRLDVVLIDSPVINAFAAPGGIVGINYGLFTYGQTEHEISAILAHELAHLSQRHFARGVEAGKKTGVINLAGLLASVILMTTVGGDAGMAAFGATQGLVQNKYLTHSRARESEADRVGIDTLVEAGMDPRAMAYMFERLERANRYSSSRVPEFLRTHPVTKSRISDAYNQTRKYVKETWPPNVTYQLMRTRVTALTTKSPREAISLFEAGLNDRDEVKRDANQYGLVLSLIEDSQTDEATRLLRPLLDKYGSSILFQIAEADIHAKAQRYDQALELLENALAINPGNYPLTMTYAEVLISANRPVVAEEFLLNLSAERKNDEYLWYLLAEAYGLANDIPGVHQARAEFFVLNGNFDQAIKQLGYAIPLVRGNFQQNAKIKQRIEEIWELRAKH